MHRMIARIADNPILSAAFDLLDSVRMSEDWQHKRHMARTSETRAVYHAHHQKIIAAIDARDAEAASAAMIEHLRTLTDNLRWSLEDAS